MADSSRQRHAISPARFFRRALCLLLCLACSPAAFADADKYQQLQQLRRQIDVRKVPKMADPYNEDKN